MVYIGGEPGNTVHCMALNAIFWKPSRNMIRVFSCQIIILVAIITLNSEGFKSQKWCWFVTNSAIGSLMCSHQWEPATLMHFSDVIYYPGICWMTSVAIRSYGLIVNICVTINTSSFSFWKNQGRVTGPTIFSFMLSCKWKRSFIVIKSVDGFIQFPAIGIMA